MVHLNLCYFNTIQGPQVFQTFPEDADENIIKSAANLLNISELLKQKFFIYEGANFKTISLYFEVPSQWARGKKEMLLLNTILPPDFGSIENKEPIKGLLQKIEAEINQIENGFMGFYEYDFGKMEEFEDEITEIALKIRNIVDNYGKKVEITLREARKASAEQIREAFKNKQLGGYVVDDDFLTYLFEIEQDKTPFVRFADFLESGISVFTSQSCIEDLQVTDSIRENVVNFIGSKEIPKEAIEKLKQGVDPRRLPSDAKLSLIVLIRYLKEINPEEDLTIVSPNHKYLRFIQDYFPQMRSLPPSSFLMEITNNLEKKDTREYFENLRKKLVNFELQKAMADRDVTASSEHLTWLFEKAIGVASQPFIPLPTAEEKKEAGLSIDQLAIINRFVGGEEATESDFAKIQEFEGFLKGVREAQLSLKQIQEEIANDQLASALTKIFSSIKELSNSFLLASATLIEKEQRNQMQSFISKFIANFQFLAALSHLNLRQIDQSIERFSLAATFSAITGQRNKVLISNYLKSITYLFNDFYQEAIAYFGITGELGAKYGNPGYQIMSLGGKAISELLAGNSNAAYQTIELTAKLIQNNEYDALVMFNEFGDFFHMMGKPEIAIHLYNEALQLAIFINNQQASTDIFDKLTRSFYAVGAYNTPLSVELHYLIEKAHALNDPDTIDKYNMQIAKLGGINQMLFEPFPYLTEEWIPGEALNPTLLDALDLLHVVVENKVRKKGEKRYKISYTDLYCYHRTFGGVIIRFPEALDLKLKDLPVIHKIALKTKGAQYKIVDSSTEDKQNYYSRAIIMTKSKNNIVFKREFPEIFGKFFED